MRVHLVDGTFELFRGFYGPPKQQNADGVEIGATRSLMRSMASLLAQPDVSHVAIAFDTVIESFRNELFDGYKTGAGIDPELHGQFPLAERVCAALGLVVWPMVEFEADDAIATFADIAAADERVEQVVMCSPDKDLYQCIRGDKVISLDRVRKKTWNEAGVEEKLSIAPTMVPDYLALVGDTADGVPGLPRWGAKSTATVLKAFGHIEAIPDDYAAWNLTVRGGAKLAEILSQQRADANLYKRLTTLRRDVPLTQTVDDLRWQKPGDSFTETCQFLELDPASLRLPFDL